MPKKKILYYSVLKYQATSLELMHKLFDVIELESPTKDTRELLSEVDIVLAPLGYSMGKIKIDMCRNLCVIGSNTTGHPHIDVSYAKRNGIKVITLKHERDFLETITPTSELAWGLLIALTRQILPAVQSTREGLWDRRPFPGRKMLSRMSIGIVGLGRLGLKISQYSLAFGMKVSYYDPNVESFHPEIRRFPLLNDLVKSSDVVTVHVPHEKKTEKMFDAKVFSNFKKGSYFINTSRGELVDHFALLQALEEGAIAGAAVDVFSGEFEQEFEEKLVKHPLWRYAQSHNNLIVTPHIGGSTLDAWSETEQHTLRRIHESIL